MALTERLGISMAFVEQVSRSSSKTKPEGSSQLMNRHTSQWVTTAPRKITLTLEVNKRETYCFAFQGLLALAAAHSHPVMFSRGLSICSLCLHTGPIFLMGAGYDSRWPDSHSLPHAKMLKVFSSCKYLLTPTQPLLDLWMALLPAILFITRAPGMLGKPHI